MDLDRIDWTTYRPEETGRALTEPHFYFCVTFAALMMLFLASCSNTPTKADSQSYNHEPGYLRR